MSFGKSKAEKQFRHTLASLMVTIGVVGTLATFCFPSICGAVHGDGPAAEKLQDANPDSLPLDDETPAKSPRVNAASPNKNVAQAYHIHVA